MERKGFGAERGWRVVASRPGFRPASGNPEAGSAARRSARSASSKRKISRSRCRAAASAAPRARRFRKLKSGSPIEGTARVRVSGLLSGNPDCAKGPRLRGRPVGVGVHGWTAAARAGAQARDALGVPEQNVAMGLQAVEQPAKDTGLRRRIEVDEDVPAQDEVELAGEDEGLCVQ